MKRTIVLYLTFLMLCLPIIAQSPILAFPGAEGYGAYSEGGRGGEVYEVTNLNDSGAGSLRACVDAETPRTCVFRVGGTITLEKSLIIDSPYITIAGQTAPGGGVTLRNSPDNDGATVRVQAHDVIIRYIRIRTGASQQLTNSNQSLALWSGYNIMIDHVSMSWATDQILTVYTYPKTETLSDVTVQWSFITEGLDSSTHEKGRHGTGAIVSSDNNTRISLHHNLFAHNDFRNPRVSGVDPLDVVNNVFYNYGRELSFGDGGRDGLGANFVNNLILSGPSSTTVDRFIKLSTNYLVPMKIYVSGNIDDRYRIDNTLPDELSVIDRSRAFMVDEPIGDLNITLDTCHSVTDCDVLNAVLKGAGANVVVSDTGKLVTRRDAVDVRIIGDVENRQGQIIDATGDGAVYNPDSLDVLQKADYVRYGIEGVIADDGYPVLESGTPAPDSDHDGIPDAFEVRYGLNPDDASDGKQDADGDGYTNLEEYLNGTPVLNIIQSDEKESNTMEFEQVMQILMLASGVLIFWWSHKSFPPQQTSQLLMQLAESSKQTKTQLDDMLVEVARMLNDMRMMGIELPTQPAVPASPPADNTGETAVQ